MKDKILQIIKNKPKHYVKIISADAELNNWVLSNTKTNSNHYPTKIYSAIYAVETKCKYNNEMTVSRFNSGLKYCGIAKVCKCNCESISKNVSKTKLEYTIDQKHSIEIKRMETMMTNYGYAYNSQRPEVKESQSPKISIEAYNKLIDYNWLNTEYNINQRTSVDIANELNVYYSTVIEYCKKFNFDIRQYSNYSLEEKEIREFLTNLGIIYESNNRSILAGKELDIYIPSHKIAIELNGTYWHSCSNVSDMPKFINKHKSKYEACEKLGIKLIQLTDVEWNRKKHVFKSYIKNLLGLSTIVTLDNYSIKEINNIENFVSENSLYDIKSNCNFGLYNNNDNELNTVVQLNQNNNRFEIVNVIHKVDNIISNGLDLIVKYIRYNILADNDVLYYRKKCDIPDIDNSNLLLYRRIRPQLYWTNTKELITTPYSVKQKLHMIENKYRMYWDSGSILYICK